MLIASAYPQTQAPQQPVSKPVSPQQPPVQEQKWVDSLALTAGYGAAGSNAIGTMMTLPTEIIKVTDTIHDLSKSIKFQNTLLKLAQAEGVLAKTASRAATGAAQLLQHSETLSKAAEHVMKTPVIGRLTQPQVAKVMSEKVLPVVNAIGASVAIYDNGKKYLNATAQQNRSAQVVSGLQIGLNVVSGISGFVPGKGQIVSAIAGFGSLALDITTWTTGFGALPKT